MSYRYRIGGVLGRPPFSILLRVVTGRPRSYLKAILYHDIPPESMIRVRKQLEFLHNEYGFIDPARLSSYRDESLSDIGVRLLLTFDDGFKSHAIVAREILDPLGIHAVFFIPSLLLDFNNRDERRAYIASSIFRRTALKDLPAFADLMEPEDLKQLISTGQVIGAHSRTHPVLAAVSDPARLREEILGSGDALEQALGAPVEWFAYPFGQASCINAEALRLIRQRYKFCCSGVRGIIDRNFRADCILRDPIEPAYPDPYLRFVVNDGLGFLYRKDARLLSQMAIG